jgi:hypothetical protein
MFFEDASDFYKRAYAILVELGGALPFWEEQFVHYFTTESGDTLEWRFQGKFGYGGKFWRRYNNVHDVTCYSEDITNERKKLIKEINKRLKALTP